MVATKQHPLIVVVGETATGKSQLAMILADKFDGEIINADSWSVYKGFDIGTAKPSKQDQRIIKHHLIDIADPKHGFSAAIFKRLAGAAMGDIISRGKLPILSGGSGLYVDSVLFSYSFLPASSPELRDKYNQMDTKSLLKLIKKFKYDTTGIDLDNKRRLIRLLENKGLKPKSQALRPNTIILGIKSDVGLLKSKIEQRVDTMITDGLLNEVKDLSAKYGWDIEPMKGIGYREFRNYFDGKASLDETRQIIINDSLKLAKKQRTWFKRNNSIQWIDNKSNIVELVTTFLNKLN